MNTKFMSEKLGLQTSGEMPEPQQDALGESQDVWSPRQWWLIQIVFWLGFSAITFLTLTVWYATVEMSHVLHTLLQGLLGLILCWPLSRIFLSLGDLELSQRIPLCLFAVAAVALLWTLCVWRPLSPLLMRGDCGRTLAVGISLSLFFCAGQACTALLLSVAAERAAKGIGS